MNENTEKNINEAIDWLQQTGGSIQDFAVEQAPLYCQEIIRWEITRSVGGMGFAVFLIAIAIALGFSVKKSIHKWRLLPEASRSKEGPGMVRTISAFVLAGFSLLPFMNGAYKLARVISAPRVVIVEHLRNLAP